MTAPAAAVERVIVLPLTPEPGTDYDGLGPAVQNVIENVLSLNPNLEETYFLRHMRAIFPSAGVFQANLMGWTPLEKREVWAAGLGARFTMGGTVLQPENGDYAPRVKLFLFDSVVRRSQSVILPVDAGDGLVTLKKGVVDFFDQVIGLDFPPEQAAKAIRPERTSLDALRIFGQSYGSYELLGFIRENKHLDLELAARAVKAAPESYLAVNMQGWQFKAAGRLDQAAECFRKALELDPNGVDALDGMMQTAFHQGGIDAATPWALRKSKVRGGALGPVLSQLHYRQAGTLWSRRSTDPAWQQLRTAVALDPLWDLPWLELADIQSRLSLHQEAKETLDRRVNRGMSLTPALTARLMNVQARELRLAGYRRWMAGDLAGQRTCLDEALALLDRCPYPSYFERWLCGWELAMLLKDMGTASRSVDILKNLRPVAPGQRFLTDCALSLCQCLVDGPRPHLQERFRRDMRKLAESLRTGEPVPLDAYEILAETAERLGEGKLARALRRQQEAAMTVVPRNG